MNLVRWISCYFKHRYFDVETIESTARCQGCKNPHRSKCTMKKKKKRKNFANNCAQWFYLYCHAIDLMWMGARSKCYGFVRYFFLFNANNISHQVPRETPLVRMFISAQSLGGVRNNVSLFQAMKKIGRKHWILAKCFDSNIFLFQTWFYFYFCLFPYCD